MAKIAKIKRTRHKYNEIYKVSSTSGSCFLAKVENRKEMRDGYHRVVPGGGSTMFFGFVHENLETAAQISADKDEHFMQNNVEIIRI